MEQIEIISGKDLIKRLSIPPYALLDDLRYRGKFCPRNKKTGTPIPPAGRKTQKVQEFNRIEAGWEFAEIHCRRDEPS
jgi:hypothetical protein